MTAITDDLPAQLIHQEHEGWEAMTRGEGGSHSFQAMLPEAIMVFPGTLLERGAVIAALDGVVWGSYALSEQRVVRLGDRAAMLVYRLRGVRDREAVDLWATTTYVYVDGRWRVGAHQQSPASD